MEKEEERENIWLTTKNIKLGVNELFLERRVQ
jgi:hypothetical protein